MTWIKKWPTGSAYIGADPDRGPQDIDFLGYVPEEHRDEQFNTLSARGWEVCGLGYSKQDDDKWCAFRKGDENLILCWCPLVYLRWVAFTELAKRCQFIHKFERIELCKAVLEGDVEAAHNIVLYSGFNLTAGTLMQGYRLMTGGDCET